MELLRQVQLFSKLPHYPKEDRLVGLSQLVLVAQEPEMTMTVQENQLIENPQCMVHLKNRANHRFQGEIYDLIQFDPSDMNCLYLLSL